MKTLRRFVKRLLASALGRRDEDRVREELAEHLTLLTDEYARAGLPLDEARRRAKLKLGAGDAATEAYRDEQRLRPLEDTWQDIRYAFRILRRVPVFAAVAILSIGLGIGANAAIFSVVNAVMFRALPYAEPERLVGIWGTHVRTGGRQFLSPAAFLDVKSETATLAQVEAAEYVTFNLVTGTSPLRVAGARASAGIFSLLGLGAVNGRTFLQSEDGFGSPPVAVLSYGLWQRQFGSDPRIDWAVRDPERHRPHCHRGRSSHASVSLEWSRSVGAIRHELGGAHSPPHEQRPGLWPPQARGLGRPSGG